MIVQNRIKRSIKQHKLSMSLDLTDFQIHVASFLHSVSSVHPKLLPSGDLSLAFQDTVSSNSNSTCQPILAAATKCSRPAICKQQIYLSRVWVIGILKPRREQIQYLIRAEPFASMIFKVWKAKWANDVTTQDTWDGLSDLQSLLSNIIASTCKGPTSTQKSFKNITVCNMSACSLCFVQ